MTATSRQFPDDDYPPLSALNDLLYCERRCGLHRNEVKSSRPFIQAFH